MDSPSFPRFDLLSPRFLCLIATIGMTLEAVVTGFPASTSLSVAWPVVISPTAVRLIVSEATRLPIHKGRRKIRLKAKAVFPLVLADSRDYSLREQVANGFSASTEALIHDVGMTTSSFGMDSSYVMVFVAASNAFNSFSRHYVVQHLPKYAPSSPGRFINMIYGRRPPALLPPFTQAATIASKDGCQRGDLASTLTSFVSVQRLLRKLSDCDMMSK